MVSPSSSYATFLLLLFANAAVGEEELCISDSKTFTVKVDLHASERGYYYFEECGKQVNPTIGMEFGETYTFIQEDKSNFWHPLSFAYFPDAHHVGGDMLQPHVMGQSLTGANAVVSRSTEDDCSRNMTCPAPMYMLNDGYLGAYSNIPEIEEVTVNKDDNGLKTYENLFFKGMSTWKGYGTFSVKLRFDDEQYVHHDLFYYCHFHQFMAGRIKLLKDRVPINELEEPPLYYERESPGEFDEMCGTYGLDAFQLPHPQCPRTFVCDPDDSMKDFASCIDAMDCHMVYGMTTKVSSGTELALFLHQMIPHHQNAVNMAKALLKAGFLPCEDLTNEEDPYCVMQGLLYGIVNRQNFEIGIMSNVLAAMNLPRMDDCEVEVGDPEGQSRALRSMATTAAGAIFGAAMQAF
ncbi:expressed unknown protein [Seminavis robusta]|uniref:DUF305 domain-containing protein n=1 Tax=Seminavis robusta TaxID=568900 RepID=A0A9N8E367_9STRA|nr:expressed unknown protein [Seminavis robusta]|eukprot:Sro602_g173780.1 n/a (407) ;mRNA; r:46268-47583